MLESLAVKRYNLKFKALQNKTTEQSLETFQFSNCFACGFLFLDEAKINPVFEPLILLHVPGVQTPGQPLLG